MGLGCEVVLELDIRKFFDSVDRRQMEEILGKRVRDGVLLRLIGKWLHAGVQHEDSLVYPEAGTPQGGVISPILANIYLHEVLDTWFERDVKPRLKGRGFMVRFADDAVMGFSRWEDARRVMAVLPKRFGRYGLTLHPEKTRLVPFRRPPREGSGAQDGDRSGSFDFLGFTHHWGRSRKGNYVVKQKTAKTRLRRAVVAVYEWCRSARHQKVREQHRELVAKVRGHFQYYGVTGNYRSLRQYLQAVVWAWRTWLGRRSQGRRRGRDWFTKIWARYPLPRPRIAHSYVS
jgi:group II intron reverse transcriptase/maturase